MNHTFIFKVYSKLNTLFTALSLLISVPIVEVSIIAVMQPVGIAGQRQDFLE
mgnify:CR=1 FL=1